MSASEDILHSRGSSGPTWTTPAGLIEGFFNDGIAQASGIRYAAAQRFHVPIAEAPVSVPIQATTPSPACPQPPDRFAAMMNAESLEKVLGFSEDCLRLTVRCPTTSNGNSTLPVLVWLHGGSYCSGAADAPFYNTSTLVKTQNVITVNVNYRLGLLGYMDGQDKKPANLGLLDQIMALEWVQKNISAFGGDVSNVTLFGQSAGADAILHLMLTPFAEKLFQKAIIQSAPFGVMAQRQEMLGAMRKLTHTMPEDATLDDIYRMQERASRQASKYGLPGYMPFGVQYGVYPLPAEDDIGKSYARVASKIKIMIGYTRREVAAFSCVVPALRILLSVPLLSTIAEYLLISRLTRSIYVTGFEKFIEQYKTHGGCGFTYSLDSVSQNKIISAGHCTDLPLLFQTPADWQGSLLASGIPAETLERQAADLKAIWAQFARTGTVEEVKEPGFLFMSKF